MAERLKPCPFCSSSEQTVERCDDTPEGFDVTCNSCCGSIFAISPEHAARDWNRRTPGPATKAMLEFAKSALDDGFPIRSIDAVFQAFIDEWKNL